MFTKTFASLLNHSVYITDCMEVLSKNNVNKIQLDGPVSNAGGFIRPEGCYLLRYAGSPQSGYTIMYKITKNGTPLSEFKEMTMSDAYDYVILNDEVDRAAEEIISLIKQKQDEK